MSTSRMRLLILGGYGTFGGRLAQLLVDEPALTLMLAGRSIAKAEAFCRDLPAGAERIAARFDRNADVESQLRQIAPDLVVDATGPFQFYGDDPYRVVKACLALRINYMDLADGSAFVKDIAQFDREARARNVYVLSGVSSFPVLTAAVARRLARGMTQVKTITAGIAPSPFANVGLNVIRAIAGYSGKGIPIVRSGRKTLGHALAETMRYTIAPPGYLPLANRRFSLVDVPDLQVLPGQWPDLQSIWVGAAPVPEILHRLLNMLARLVQLQLLPSVLSWAPLMHRAINVLRWGEHRGGMFVEITGTDSGREVKRSWHLLAEGERGPFIPSMAVEAIVRRILAGHPPRSGARPAITELELEDYETLFLKRGICTGHWDESAPDHCLYRRLLGDAWQRLPPTLQAMHDCRNELQAEGIATVERGRGFLSHLAAAIMGFPKAGRDIPVKVHFRTHRGGEVWRRTFGRKSFSSSQTAGRGRTEKLLCERFGPLTVAMAVVVENDRLNLIVRRSSVFAIPLPRWLAPRSHSYEFAQDGRFHFNVEISHALTGPIVTYRGWLVPTTQSL